LRPCRISNQKGGFDSCAEKAFRASFGSVNECTTSLLKTATSPLFQDACIVIDYKNGFPAIQLAASRGRAGGTGAGASASRRAYSPRNQTIDSKARAEQRLNAKQKVKVPSQATDICKIA